MEITEVRVFLVGEEKLKAFVSVVLDRCFMLNDVKVIQGRQGLFISMPSRRKKSGEFKDVAHPLNNETRSWMEDRILREYEQQLHLQRNGGRNGRPTAVAGAGSGDATRDQTAPSHEGRPGTGIADRRGDEPWPVGWAQTGARP